MTAFLLVCGIASSVLYAATDIIGGLSYGGYSFTSQVISELMARGAPSEAIVDPLFLAYNVLVLAFGAGVIRAGGNGNRALRTVGVLLITYALLGFTGPTLFEMDPRGSGTPSSDVPHIVVTAAILLLTMLAIGFAASALGSRFRIYSVVTVLVMIAFGALTASSGAQLAAGNPTPGFGILERINIYALMVWIAVLAIALLRRRVSEQTFTGPRFSARPRRRPFAPLQSTED